MIPIMYIYVPIFRNFRKKLQLLIIHVLTYATMMSLFQVPLFLDLVGCFFEGFPRCLSPFRRT